MLPILSSATHPVKPVLNREADKIARFSAPPDQGEVDHDQGEVDHDQGEVDDVDCGV